MALGVWQLTAPVSSLANKITADNYGDYVNYSSPTTIGVTSNTLEGSETPKTDWRIYYNDGNNVYLIASDFIPVGKVPSAASMTTTGTYQAYYNSVPSFTLNTTYQNSFLFSKMNKVTSSNNNYKCSAGLLNSANWTSFVNTTYATSAIGGPTLEMMCESINDRYPSETLRCGANTTGYTVGFTMSALQSSDYSISGKSWYSNNLYYTHKGVYSGCYGYRLASPCANGTSDVWCAYCGGYVDYPSYSYSGFGLRPVVMLKSNIDGTKNANGVWQLEN